MVRVLLTTILALLAAASPASAATKPKLTSTVPTAVAPGGRAAVSGHWSAAGATRAVLQRRLGRRWNTVSKRPLRNGRFALAWRAPRRAGTYSLRIAIRRHGRTIAVSPSYHVLVARKPATTPITTTIVPPSAGTEPKEHVSVVEPTEILEAPPAGAGEVRLAAGTEIKPGQVIASDVGPATPNGMLSKVVSVREQDGALVATVIPAALQDVIAEGALDVKIDSAPAAPTASAAADPGPTPAEPPLPSPVLPCEGGGSATLIPEASFHVGAQFTADWSLLNPIPDAHFSAEVSAHAAVLVTATGTATCKVSTKLLGKGKSLGVFTVMVGPLPVVFNPVLNVNVSATANLNGDFSAYASADFETGVGLDIENLTDATPWVQTPTTTFRRSVNARAGTSLSATLTPNIQLLLYGVGGPQLAVSTGLKFDADTAKTPWWTLSLPVGVSLDAVVPSLGVDLGPWTPWSHSFTLLEADGPFHV